VAGIAGAGTFVEDVEEEEQGVGVAIVGAVDEGVDDGAGAVDGVEAVGEEVAPLVNPVVEEEGGDVGGGAGEEGEFQAVTEVAGEAGRRRGSVRAEAGDDGFKVLFAGAHRWESRV
jgi:hypothetical protein